MSEQLFKIIVPKEEHNIGQLVYNNLYCYVSNFSLYFGDDRYNKVEVVLAEESRKKLDAYNKIHKSGYVYRPLIIKKYLHRYTIPKVLENEWSMGIIKIGSIVKIKTPRDWCMGVYNNTIGIVINKDIHKYLSNPEEYFKVRLRFEDAIKVEKFGYISEPTIINKFLFPNNSIVIGNEWGVICQIQKQQKAE